MGSNIRDSIRWAIATMVVLVPIMSMIYSAVTYGAVATMWAFVTIVFVAMMAYFLRTAIIDAKKTIDKVLADDKRGRL